MQTISCLFNVLLILMAGCKTTYIPDDYPGWIIQFGNGGGFTGAYSNYYLLGNGQLYARKSGEEEYTKLQKVKKKDARAFYERLLDAGIHKVEFNHPGNMTWYVSLKENDDIYLVRWGQPGPEPPQTIKSIYEDLYRLVRD